MNCEDFRECTVALLFGDLSAGELSAAETHRDQCEACSDRLEDLKRLRARLADFSVPDAPSSDVDLIRAFAALRRPAAVTHSSTAAPNPWRKVAVTAAAFVVIAALLVLMSARVDLTPGGVELSLRWHPTDPSSRNIEARKGLRSVGAGAPLQLVGNGSALESVGSPASGPSGNPDLSNGEDLLWQGLFDTRLLVDELARVVRRLEARHELDLRVIARTFLEDQELDAGQWRREIARLREETENELLETHQAIGEMVQWIHLPGTISPAGELDRRQ